MTDRTIKEMLRRVLESEKKIGRVLMGVDGSLTQAQTNDLNDAQRHLENVRLTLAGAKGGML